MKILQIILAILLPPVAIFQIYGFSSTLLINILLTCLGVLPGSIHAVWAVTKHQEQTANI